MTSGIKRSHGEYDDSSSKKARLDIQAPKILIINSPQEVCKNMVWLSQSYVNSLFMKNANQAKYIAIADKVYTIGINNNLPELSIGLSMQQSYEIDNSVFLEQGTSFVWISPYLVETDDKNSLKTISGTIDFYGKTKKKPYATLKFDDLCKKISQTFNRFFMSSGQQFIFDYEGQQYNLEVNKTTSANSTPSFINRETKILVQPAVCSKITLVNKDVIEDDSIKACFDIKIRKNAAGFLYPVQIDKNSLITQTQEALKNQNVTIGHGFKIKKETWPSLQLFLRKIEYKDKIFIEPIDKAKFMLEQAFRLNKNCKYDFYKAADITLVASGLHPAKALDFEISSFNAISGVIASKLNWIDVCKVSEILVQRKEGICKEQVIHVTIQNTKIQMKVLKGHSGAPSAVKTQRLGRTLWKVTPETEMRFCASSRLGIPLVDEQDSKPLVEANFKILPFRVGKFPNIEIEECKITEAIRKQIKGPFVNDQKLHLSLDRFGCKVQVKQLVFGISDFVKPKYGSLGHLVDTTVIKFENTARNLQLHSKETMMDPVKQLEKFKLTAISEEFKSIFRSIIIQQKMKAEAKSLEICCERGLLLAGPPGNGKSKLATALAEILGCTEKNGRLIQISATETFAKWVGESEGNVRELFAPARAAYEKDGEASDLHVIIIDEIDGMLSKRSGDSNKVSDKVVNQFLSCIDGPNPLNNLLVIGTSNRAELIDEAALRHGRFGKLIKISNPDVKGRKSIFDLYLSPLIIQKCLDDKVDSSILAKMTENFSAADVKGAVEEAKKYALERLYYLKNHSDEMKKELVTMADFDKVIKEISERKSSGASRVPEGMYQ